MNGASIQKYPVSYTSIKCMQKYMHKKQQKTNRFVESEAGVVSVIMNNNGMKHLSLTDPSNAHYSVELSASKSLYARVPALGKTYEFRQIIMQREMNDDHPEAGRNLSLWG